MSLVHLKPFSPRRPRRPSSSRLTYHHTTSSTETFDHWFERSNYEKLTGLDLGAHHFAPKLNNTNSPGVVLDALRDRIKAFDVPRGDKKLMTWLESIIDLLFTVSAKLRESTTEAVSFKGPITSISNY